MNTRTTRRTVANLAGAGEVWTGEQSLATVRYQLRVAQRITVVTSPEGPQEIPGLQEADGMLTVLTGSWISMLTSQAGGLHLQLADGRRLPITADGSGPQLRIRATAAFMEPQAP